MAKVTNEEIDPEVVKALEAILLVAVEPVTTKLLAQVLEQPAGVVEVLCNRLAATYDAAGHGFQLVKVAGGFRLQSRPELSAYVEKFILDGQQARISSAALETLAIVATSSRSLARRFPRFAASTPNRCCARCRRAATSRKSHATTARASR